MNELIDIYFECENIKCFSKFIFELNCATFLTNYKFNFKESDIDVDLSNTSQIESALKKGHETPFRSGLFDIKTNKYTYKNCSIATFEYQNPEYEICLSINIDDLGHDDIVGKVKDLISLFTSKINFSKCYAQYESTEEIIYEINN